VGKDVEEAQELPVNPPRGQHDTRQKGVCGALPVGIRLAIPGHLGARRGLEELVDIVVAQLPVAANVPAVVAAELVGAGNVDDQMPDASPPMLASLMRRSPQPVLPLAFRTEGMSRRCVVRPAS